MAKGRRKQGLKKVAEKFGGFRNNAYICTVKTQVRMKMPHNKRLFSYPRIKNEQYRLRRVW